MSAIKGFFKGAIAFISKRGLAVGAAVLVAASAITLGALWISDSTSSAMYSVWLYSAQDTSYYKDYSDNPVLQYMLSTDEYSDISFSFTVPASDAQNSYDLMIASKSFPTLMDSSVADPVGIMYENDYILDITDYVKEYMPNYYSMLNSESENFNEALYSKVVYEIDGEEKILSINSVSESSPYANWGYAYRRDWVVNYGKNPSTGEAFTSDGDTENWEDNVMFPSYYGLSYTMDDTTYELSYNEDTAAFMTEYKEAYPDYDGSEPVTISDWEWMFEIFTTAMDELGIAYNGVDSSNGGYCISMYYTGYTALDGGLRSSFGGSGMVWYQNSEGEVSFGGTEDSTRAYLKCLNTWYENGWLDAYYNDRSTDSHYQIDKSTVSAGKVGMFLWDESILDGNYDMGTSTYADGIMVTGCAYPVNDVYDYGSGEALYKIPAYLANTSTIGTGFYVMKGADEVDLEPLFRFLDEFYSEEGALMHTLGLSEEQVSSNLSSVATTFYQEYDLADGAYTKVTDGSGKTTYKVSSTLVNGSSGLSIAASLNKMPGYEYVSSLDYGYTATHQNALNLWVKYSNTALIWGSDAMNKMSSDDKSLCEDINSNVDTYMKKNAVNFIKGTNDVDDDRTWSGWISGVNKAAGGVDQIQAVTDIFTYYLGLYPLV